MDFAAYGWETAMYRVLKDFAGSPTGTTVVKYCKGDEVVLTDPLAAVALAEKWVEPVAVKPAAKAVETAPQNKAVTKTAKNKAGDGR